MARPRNRADATPEPDLRALLKKRRWTSSDARAVLETQRRRASAREEHPACFGRESPRGTFRTGVRLRRGNRRLTQINRVRDVRELAVPPGNRLERLKGARSGQYSIRINDQYRICFRWEAGHAFEVEITDYH